MLEGLKPLFNSLLRPLVYPVVKVGIRPNHLTVAGLVFFCIAAWYVFREKWLTALIFTLVGSLLDGFDGVVARESNRKNAFGAILDSSCDRLTEIFLIFGILGWCLTSPAALLEKEIHSLPLRFLGILFCYSAITMSLMVSYIKARCEGAGIPCKRGLLQRPERIILLCIGLLIGPSGMIWILGVISLLAAITVVQRFLEAYRNPQHGSSGKRTTGPTAAL